MRVIEQMTTFYEALERNSEPAGENKLYRGYVSQIAKESGIPLGSYSMIVRKLMNMGCIAIVERGGRNTESEWVLFQPPTEDLYNATHFESSGYNKMLQRVRQVEDRVQIIERKLENNGNQDQERSG